MDNSPLNAAHQQHRRAEASMRFRRYDEAIQCHERAAELLRDALSATTSVKAAESLKLQCEYHRKQKDIALTKKEQFETFKRTIEKQKLKMEKHVNADIFKEVTPNHLQMQIHKVMDDADSKVDILMKRFYTGDSDSLEFNSIERGVVNCHNISGDVVSAVKEPKNDNVVIEELQTLNQQLRTFVDQLIIELEVTTSDRDALRDRVRFLESERNKTLRRAPSPQPIPVPRPDQLSSLETIPDAEDTVAPFFFSPGSVSPEPLFEVGELPTLAPLEMPDFDFSKLMGQMKLNKDDPEHLRRSYREE